MQLAVVVMMQKHMQMQMQMLTISSWPGEKDLGGVGLWKRLSM